MKKETRSLASLKCFIKQILKFSEPKILLFFFLNWLILECYLQHNELKDCIFYYFKSGIIYKDTF